MFCVEFLRDTQFNFTFAFAVHWQFRPYKLYRCLRTGIDNIFFCRIISRRHFGSSWLSHFDKMESSMYPLKGIGHIWARYYVKIVPYIIQLKNHSVHNCNIGENAPNNSIITCSFVYKLKNYVYQPNISKVILKHYIKSLFLSNVANVVTMILAGW